MPRGGFSDPAIYFTEIDKLLYKEGAIREVMTPSADAGFEFWPKKEDTHITRE
jgi:hypothetical protein